MPKKSNKKRSDGRIAVQVYLGMVDGKRKYKTVYGATQKEANRKADEIRSQIRGGIDFTHSDSTLIYHVNRWLDHRKVEATPVQYKDSVAKTLYLINWNPIIRGFSDHKTDRKTLAYYEITKIKLEHLQDILNALALENPHTHKPTAKETLSKIKQQICGVFDYAEYNRAITFNPTSYLKISQTAPRNDRRALTKEEQARIIEMPHRAQTAALIMMLAGLRRGEVTALLWSDIDFKANTITINKSYDFHSNSVKPPKTRAGYRVIPMPDVLSQHLKQQSKQSIYVVHKPNGELVTEGTWASWLNGYMYDLNDKYGKNLKKKSNKFAPVKQPLTIEPFTWHCLRHTYATILHDSGVDILTAQKLLGHSDAKTTMAIYTHLSAEKEQNDISKLNDFLNASQMQVKES